MVNVHYVPPGNLKMRAAYRYVRHARRMHGVLWEVRHHLTAFACQDTQVLLVAHVHVVFLESSKVLLARLYVRAALQVQAVHSAHLQLGHVHATRVTSVSSVGPMMLRACVFLVRLASTRIQQEMLFVKLARLDITLPRQHQHAQVARLTR
jgi:hypothetical protein